MSFDLVDELFAIMVEGDRCEDVFPFVQPPEASVQPDPDDTNPAPLLPSPRRPEPGDLPPFNRYGRLIES